MTGQQSATATTPQTGPGMIPGLEGLDLGALQEAVLQVFASDRMQALAQDKGAANVIPSIHSRMEPDLVVNDRGQVLMVYDQPLPDAIWWVEYDSDYRQLVFITIGGQILPFGQKIHDVMDAFLKFAHTMFFIEIDQQQKPQRVQQRRVVVRKSGVLE